MMKLKLKSFLLSLGTAFFLVVSNLSAQELDPSSFTLNGMALSPTKAVYDANYPDNDTLITFLEPNNLLNTESYDATHTAGIYDGNDTGTLKPVNNIGELNDGLLNGEGDFFPGGAFIGEEGNYLQDANNDGSDPVDPGWIMLGEFEIDEDEPEYPYSKLGGVTDIGTLLQITFDFEMEWETGNWVLWTDPDKMALVYAELGYAAFDNLAFVIKSGNENNDGGWAVYDFNFNTIFREEGEAGDSSLNFETAYTLWGDFDDKDFLTNDDDQRDISHFSVWARDPDLSQVPEPATILLFGFGLLGMAHIGRRKK